ncbi:MAG: Fe-S cluster assembly protein SufD [Spirochaetaceae bacterium]|nr:MAG: Fe-S cluster assembly protein SufD [Spirochaetaceae bacterium]
MKNNTVGEVFTGVDGLGDYIGSLPEPDWMRETRLAALERFSTMDWPDTAVEEWRRSDISSYDFNAYNMRGAQQSAAADSADPQAEPDVAGRISFEGPDAVATSLDPDLASQGVIFEPLSEFVLQNSANHGGNMSKATRAVRDLIMDSVHKADNKLKLWHYAGWTHGVVLYVPRFMEIKNCFVLDFQESGDSVISAPQVFVVLEEGARVEVIQRVHGADEGVVLLNESVDIHIGDGAACKYVALHNLNIDSSSFGTTLARISRDGHLHHGIAAFGSMFTKFRVDAELNGPGSDVLLDGIYYPAEDQHVDLRTVQTHFAPKCASHALYRGAIRDEAHGVYQGLIYVGDEGSETDAYLTNNNLLLNDGAQADSIPCLQIHTNDVKCSHGSTTGKLNRNEVFYLASRGFSPEEAEEILLQGFFEPIVARLPGALQEEIRDLIAARFVPVDIL